MRKRIFSLLIVLSLLLSLVVPANAAIVPTAKTEDVKIQYSLEVNGEHNITVKQNDIITVKYYMIPTLPEGTQASISSNQNQITFDKDYLEFQSASVTKDKFTNSTHLENTPPYVFFNSGTSFTVSKNQSGTPIEIGTITFKVTAASGTTYVQNTNNKAQDSKEAFFGKENLDLTITIGDDVGPANQYTVTFNANGGEVAPASETVNQGAFVSLPTPEREGLIFAGWKPTGGETLDPTATQYVPTTNITLTAQWKAQQPTGLAGVMPTTVDGSDGKITGVTTDMDYKPQSRDSYTACTGTEITGLSAGTYEIRMRGGNEGGYDYLPSDPVQVIVPAKEPEIVTGVCRIGETPYPTLQAAIEAAQTGETITMLQNITGAGGSSFDFKSKEINLELAGNKLTGSVANAANVTVKNTPAGECCIGDTVYQSLADAIAAASDNDTITLLKDVVADTINYGSKKLTVKMQGYTITGTEQNNTSVTKTDAGEYKENMMTLAATGVYKNDVSPFAADDYDTKKTTIDNDTVYCTRDPGTYRMVVEVTPVGDDRNTDNDEADVYPEETFIVKVKVFGARFVGANFKLKYDAEHFTLESDEPSGWEWFEDDGYGYKFNAAKESGYWTDGYTLGEFVFSADSTDEVRVGMFTVSDSEVQIGNARKSGLSSDKAITLSNADKEHPQMIDGKVNVIIPGETVAVTGVSVKESTTLVIGETETLTATVSPENATNKTVTWTSDKPEVATVNSTTGEVTAVGAGKATITATTVDGSFKDTCEVTVNKKTPVITGTPTASVTYGDAVDKDDISLQNVTIMDGAKNVIGTVVWKGNVTSYGNATNGTPRDLTATFIPDDEDTYESVDVTVRVTVAKGTQTITAENQTVLIGGELSIVASTNAADDGATLTYAINGSEPAGVSISGNKLTVADTASEGTVTININSAATDNYAAAEQKQITVTISNKADAGVSFTAPEPKTYGDEDFTIKATVTTAGTNGTWTWTSSDPTILQIVEGNTDTVKVKVLKADATGATLTAKYESDTTAGSSTSAAIPVVPKTVSLSWYQESSFTNQYSSAYTYNGSEQGVYAKVTNAVSGDDVTVSTMTGNTATDANASDQSYTATATVLGGDDAANYALSATAANNQLSWKINPRNISGATITLGTALTYTGGEQTQTVTGVALTNPDLTLTTSDYTVSDNKGTNVKTNGDYTLTVTGTGNYTGTATKAWNIANATDNAISGLAITGWNYGSTANTPSATAKYGTPTYTYYTDEACTTQTTAANSGAAGNGKVPVNAGTYYVKASVAGTANYNEASDSTSFTIGKANYATSVSGKTVNVFYGKTDATTVTLNDITGTLPTGAAIKSVAKGTDTNNIIGEITSAAFNLNQEPELTSEAVGQTATLNVTISSTNYNDINVDVTVKLIEKSDEALTVTQQNWTYGQNPVAPGFTAPDGSETPVITYSGTANDGSTYGPSATPPTKAGNYTVKVVCETADSIYTGTADFRIARAIPTGDPGYTKITTNGKTLADANLTKNANWPDGTIVWNDGNTTSVEKNKAYDWTFTPDDENNYTTLSDSIIPYVYHPFNGHAVKLAGDDHGTVDTDASTAKPGETVTVEVKADKGYQLYALEVIDYDGNELKLKENKDGSYSFEMPNSSVTVRAQFVAVGDYKLCPRDYTCPIEPYTDTVNDAWWHDGIHYCVENGLMRGITEHEFAPGAFTNRQQVWMILARISGENPANMAEARAWAMKTGVSDGTNPTAPITRQQLAAMLYRFAGSPAVKGELCFTDSDKVSAYAVDAVLWCSDKGIVGGYTDGSFKPLDNASRAHIAAMIQRFCVNILGK